MIANVNDGGYYSRPGYLHRYYLFCSPYWKEAQSLSVNPQENKIKDAIESFRKKEDAALTDFCKLFTSDNPTPAMGIQILDGLLTDTNEVFDKVWEEISSKDTLDRTILNSIKEISKKALHETIEKGKSENTQEIVSQIKSRTTRAMNQLLGASGEMKVSQQGATLGNWFERYFSTLINAAYMTKVAREQGDLEKWKREMAIQGTISDFKGSELLSEQTGDSRYGKKQSTYDIEVNVKGENPLPIQMKAGNASGKKILSLPATDLDLLLDDTIDSSTKDIVRFAIIHQHAFSDPNYVSLVNSVNEDRKARGITPVDMYTTGSNPSAIEKLNSNPSGLLDSRFINVINVLRYAIAVKTIAGIAEGKEALIYVISKTGTKTKGHTRDAVLRVSDMLEATLGTKSKISSNPWKITQAKDSLSSVPGNILKLYEEEPLETRQQWYDATADQMLHAVNKIKLSMEFNYANVGG